jgi:hypothetical protein
MEDQTSREQLLEAFRGIASDKVRNNFLRGSRMFNQSYSLS